MDRKSSPVKMEVTIVEKPLEDVREFVDEPRLSPEQVQHVAEIFNTPLTGAYNWEYSDSLPGDGNIDWVELSKPLYE